MVREDVMCYIRQIFNELNHLIWFRMSWGDTASSLLFIYGGGQKSDVTFEVLDCHGHYTVTTWDDGIVVEVELASLKEVVTFLKEYYK